jgi:hypothetical protein
LRARKKLIKNVLCQYEEKSDYQFQKKGMLLTVRESASLLFMDILHENAQDSVRNFMFVLEKIEEQISTAIKEKFDTLVDQLDDPTFFT